MSGSETVHRFASRGGAEVVAYDWGGGPANHGPGLDNTAPVLLIAHATGLHGHVYEPLADALRATFRCIALDMRGHGSARRPDDSDFNWLGMTTDVETAMDGLGLTGRPDVHGFGHSMGGCALVRAQIHRPDRFCRLFLFEPIIFEPQVHANVSDGDERPTTPTQTTQNFMAQAASRRREVFPSRDAAFETYAGKLPWSSVDDAALRAYVTHGFVDQPNGTVQLACPREDEAAVFENAFTDTFPRIGAVTIPVTIAVGADSEVGHIERAAVLEHRFVRARRIVLDQRTHFGPFERVPEFANQILSAFAQDPPGRGRG